MEKKYDVFISYSRSDLKQVTDIKAKIEDTTGAHCWMDLEGIESGVPRFTKAIIDGIKNCRVFLFMCSGQSQKSEFALRELNYASKRCQHVVIVRIDNKPLNDEFEFLYSLTDTIEWDNQPQREKLFRDIIRWIGKKEEEETKNMKKVKTKLKVRGKAIEEKRLKGAKITILFNWLKKFWKWLVTLAVIMLFIFIFGMMLSEKTKGTADIEHTDQLEYSEQEDSNIFELRKRAEQGDAAAQYNLGLMYRNGEGVPQSDADAVEWYRKAAEQGLAAAQCNLGLMYYLGNGVPESYADAVEWYRKAAEQGYARAQYKLGCMYLYGKGVPQSDADAVEWYSKAAEQGDADAQFLLGQMYEDGNGVPQSYTDAVKWYRKAAEQVEQCTFSPYYELGRMYEEGKGVPQSDADAVEWYRKAAEQGNTLAKYALQRLTGK
jgi:hypothetical protein